MSELLGALHLCPLLWWLLKALPLFENPFIRVRYLSLAFAICATETDSRKRRQVWFHCGSRRRIGGKVVSPSTY